MKITENENQEISLDEASILTQRYRNSQNEINPILGGYFLGKNLKNVLNQDLCEGVRIYNALDSNNELTYVIVGIDSDGNDLINGIILEHAVRCPNKCSNPNPLNS